MDSPLCPSIVLAEVCRAEEEYLKRLGHQDSLDADEDGGSEEEEEEEEEAGNVAEWVAVMRGDDNFEDKESGDSDLFMGDSSTNQQQLSCNCGWRRKSRDTLLGRGQAHTAKRHGS
jgi:hypothetical protein